MHTIPVHHTSATSTSAAALPADDATERERNENDARGGSSHAERERWMERVDEGDAGGQREGERRRAAAAASRERVGRRARG